MIKYSFIIPVYNTKKYLDRCIQSILKQSYQHYEILLIDDGSTDGSSELCDNLSKIDNRIKVFHQVNSGVSTARNNGIKHGVGDYIIFVDSDDWLSLNYLECIEYLTSSSDSEIYCYNNFTTSTYIKENKKNSFNPVQIYTTIKFIKSIKFSPALWSYVFKRSIIEKHALSLNKELKYSEDSNFIFKYLCYTNHVATINERLYYYFLHSDSAIHQNFTHDWAECNLKACLDIIESKNYLKTTSSYIKRIISYYLISYFTILFKMKSKDVDKVRRKEQFIIFCSIITKKYNINTAITSKWCTKHLKVTQYICCISFYIDRLKQKIFK